jgi:hypothetical protein
LARYVESGASPESYGAFAHAVKNIESKLNLRTSADAELRLAVMAFEHLNLHLDQPWPKQAEIFVGNVWSEALDAPVNDGEDWRAYLMRICRSSLATECRRSVPAFWPEIVGAYVWEVMADRAKNAVSTCKDCDGIKDADAVVKGYEAGLKRVRERVKVARKKGLPTQWPTAFDGLKPLSNQRVVVECESDTQCRVAPDDFAEKWQGMVKSLSPGPIALHLNRSATIGHLIRIVAACEALGRNDIELVLRDSQFPYQARLLSIGPSTKILKGLRLLKNDPIQLWVQAQAALN